MTAHANDEQLREKTQEAIKKHKSSWMELGQYLFTIYKDKHYKDWGFLSFETYCHKELKLKHTTATKLLKSYHFLEKEEPRIAQISSAPEQVKELKAVPDYESVNLLRLAKENKKITPHEFADVRHSVLEEAKEAPEVRTQVKKLLAEKAPQDTEELKISKRNSKIRRMITILMTTKQELESEDLLPKFLAKQIEDLKEKLEDQIEG